ncbi:MAG: sulfatase-like hydrolase/transferase [Gemmatimonadota bacterium]|nr:MAG: sulfatase-like hydrolase/transferase [Gemmatimonadota bacterium]
MLDKLAGEGVLFENAFTVAGVCAPNRSSIITGMYASTLGTHHMRGGGEGVKRSMKPHLPETVKCFSEYLREAGYYCTNNYKEDYNFVTPDKAWDESSRNAHWKNRPRGAPFFAVFNYTGTHEGSIRLDEEKRAERTQRLKPHQRQNREAFELPPYYPDTKVTREYWARYHELITALDYWIEDRLKELDDAGLRDETIVFFWSDHGVGMPRAKRWIYDSGTHIPLIVRIPEKFRQKRQGTPGSKDDQFVSSLDFAPAVLNLVGLLVPEYMQGRPFLGPNLPPERQYVFSIRDRMDERYDLVRSVRDKRYRYVINYMSYKPYYQYIQSAEQGPVMKEIRRLEQEGELPETVALFTSRRKPQEELYDIHNDPYEIKNLAPDPEYKDILEKMRNVHLQWILEAKDLGLIPEPEILRLEKQYGSRYAILQKTGSEDFLKRLHETAILVGKPKADDLQNLLLLLNDNNPSVRYWALIGIGNLGNEVQGSIVEVRKLLDDSSSTIRVAAAEALCKLGEVSEALPVLEMELQSDEEWIRLHAAIVIDELGEKARSTIPFLHEALNDQDNKYVVRVANHAINNLLGTNNQVR